MTAKLVEILRSGVVESIHRGDIAVVDLDGKLLYEVGDSDKLTYFRSAGKPIIALALLDYGIVEKYDLDLEEISILTSSHSGDPEHIRILNKIMEKTGISINDLECGEHSPTGRRAAKELIASGILPNRLHCDCSAKHIGMIAACKIEGVQVKGYSNVEHPIQRKIEKYISEFCGIDERLIIKGTDGCGVPVFAVPLKNIAFSYANLCNKNFKNKKYEKSQNYILSAMTKYPEMVGGQERFDTILMNNYGDRLIGKFGAEGVYCVGILEKGIGIAIKIEDGSDRAVAPTVLECLFQMNIISKDELALMNEFWNPEIKNNIGDTVGEVKTIFKLK